MTLVNAADKPKSKVESKVLVCWTLEYRCFTDGVHLPTSFLEWAQNRCGQSQATPAASLTQEPLRSMPVRGMLCEGWRRPEALDQRDGIALEVRNVNA